ncbi:hypothetical protein VST7929_01513 [Vibrio stylophorae]|uniref:Uncharacterized protein n=1 Tax=Vibrio stylophorae TaxID=659351 RepID=A0ABN8DSI1_9VIBR|nr:hypothetical protein [Vibrio stylophorae]CAH0533642.1 hypothetical protein VST7929_01513 [Vibrio stylophorae]
MPLQRQAFILNAYFGELYGIAFFETMMCSHPQLNTIWQPLLAIEQFTAAQLKSALPLDKTEDATAINQAIARGQAQACEWKNLSEPQLLDTLIRWVTPYEQQYRQWQHTHPEDRTLALIADHETTLFAALQAIKKELSPAPLYTQFYQQYR